MTGPDRDPRMLQFRSGGWVLLLAVVLVVAVAAWFLLPVITGRGGVPADPVAQPQDYDLTALDVPRDTLVAAGIPRDGLHVVDSPEVWTVEESDRRNEEERGKYLVGDDWVVGVAVGDQARAYPLRVLNWHEVVHDRLGGRDLAITFSPLTRTVRVFDREVEGDTLDLRVSGLLTDSQTVLYDRGPDGEPRSLWNPLTARAIAGPAAADGLRLDPVPASLVPWSAWREAHPATTVLRPGERLAKLYKRNPYGNYYMTGHPRFPADPMPPEGALASLTPVAVFDPDGTPLVVPLTSSTGATDRGAFPDPAWRRVPGDGTWDGLLLVDPDAATADAFPTLWFAWYAATEDR